MRPGFFELPGSIVLAQQRGGPLQVAVAAEEFAAVAGEAARAVAIGAGCQLCRVTWKQTFRLAWHFGLFQAFMPIIGWLAGLTLVKFIEPVDHWIAFGLLAFIGGKMIYEALKHQEEEADRCDPTKGWRLRNWSGACRGRRPTCTVPMTANTSTRAVFVRR